MQKIILVKSSLREVRMSHQSDCSLLDYDLLVSVVLVCGWFILLPRSHQNEGNVALEEMSKSPAVVPLRFVCVTGE